MSKIGLEDKSVKYTYQISHNLVIFFTLWQLPIIPALCSYMEEYYGFSANLNYLATTVLHFDQQTFFTTVEFKSKALVIFLCQLLEIHIYSVWVFLFDLCLFLWSPDFFSLVWHIQSIMIFDSRYTASSNHLSPRASAAISGNLNKSHFREYSCSQTA